MFKEPGLRLVSILLSRMISKMRSCFIDNDNTISLPRVNVLFLFVYRICI